MSYIKFSIADLRTPTEPLINIGIAALELLCSLHSNETLPYTQEDLEVAQILKGVSERKSSK